MKQGRTLSQLAAEIERQAKSKKDFKADTRSLEMLPIRLGGEPRHSRYTQPACPGSELPDVTPNAVALRIGEIGSFSPNRFAHQQIAERVGIPFKYYERMVQEAPALLARNVNHWFQATPEQRLVRTLDGKARAFLSNRYRLLDNYDLAEAVMPVLSDLEAEVVSCEVTERRLYIKAVSARLKGDVERGDPVQGGVVIRNSEIGDGSLGIDAFIYRLLCTNGMIDAGNLVRKAHLGKGSQATDELMASEYFTDKTQRLTDAALWAQVRDVVKGSFSEVGFETILTKLRKTTERQITGDPVKAVEVVAVKLELNETEKSSVLKHLIAGGKLSQWAVANAVTRTANDVEDYDRATELEKAGGQVIELRPDEWEQIAEAA